MGKYNNLYKNGPSPFLNQVSYLRLYIIFLSHAFRSSKSQYCQQIYAESKFNKYYPLPFYTIHSCKGPNFYKAEVPCQSLRNILHLNMVVAKVLLPKPR